MQAGGRPNCGTYLTVTRGCRRAVSLQGGFGPLRRTRQLFRLHRMADGTYHIRSVRCPDKFLSFPADCALTSAQLLPHDAGPHHWTLARVVR